LFLIVIFVSYSSRFLVCFFFFSCYGALRALLSFPTRRSSDLDPLIFVKMPDSVQHFGSAPRVQHGGWFIKNDTFRFHGEDTGDRSEEHTSELQSRFDLVCRLLLEKKKKKLMKKSTIKRLNIIV